MTRYSLSKIPGNKNSKSVAFTLIDSIYSVNSNLINQLLELANENDANNVRICLHKSGDAIFQQMLIYEKRGVYYPPHTHKNRSETHIVIKGSLELFILDQYGSVLETHLNSEHDQNITTVASAIPHLTRPISEYVIYLEIKNGPHTPFDDDCFIPRPNGIKPLEEVEYNSYLDKFSNL